MATSDKAYANNLKANAAYRAYRRSVDSEFLMAEQQSRQRYNEFNKLARAFAKRYPEQFVQFKGEVQG
jgi:hypothetical protein